ncbi:putative stress response RCI peptide [Fomitopsis betulina]|nr:putative stress response RCI peptide [Fomitopsis betulina]
MPFTGSDIIKSSLYSSFVDGLLTRISPHSFAIILPPVGVFLERGCGADLLINIVLTCLGYIPGIIHALYIILKY